jgi:hypothetical protein
MWRFVLLLTVGGLGCNGGGCSATIANLTGGRAANAKRPAMSGCPLFTPSDPWNTDVSGATVNPTWTAQINALLGDVNIHPDFGGEYGIPINIVPASQPKVPVTFDDYADESDPGPYPFPGRADAQIEGSSDPTKCDGDCHMIVVQQGTCQLYEGWGCKYKPDGWHCSNGAKWDLTKASKGQRPDGWTSADAGGLPVYAGLARYEEVAAGEIRHALRFTLPCSSNAMVPPATHRAPHCPGPNTVPLGVRVRLKANYDISGFDPVVQVFLRAFKKYGLILADNGGRKSTFFFQSEVSARWPRAIKELKKVPVSAFEAVNP